MELELKMNLIRSRFRHPTNTKQVGQIPLNVFVV